MAMTYTDAQIQQDILDEIRHDIRIDSTNLAIDVQNGVVRLYGMVESYVQKVTAGEDAQRIKGVRSVDNQLVVTVPTPWSDQEITATVRANLSRDVRISNPNVIDVSTSNAVVTLKGRVGSYGQRAAAEDDAWTAPGVVDVVNLIEVVPPFVRSDVEIAADVRASLEADPQIDTSDIQVNVVNGTVYLRGTVPTYYQIRRASDDAWNIPGVLNVVNELAVEF